MADSNSLTVVVPGDQTTVDKRRFRIIPLTTDNIDRAGIGELAVDRDSGDIYVINNDGEAISRTASLEQFIEKLLMNDFNTMSFMFNHNRRVYRLFFNESFVRLDSNLIIDDSCSYYRVRSIKDNGVYYVSQLTPIGDAAPIINTFTDNETYLVEFYNKSKEQISTMPFSAKAALYFEPKGEEGKAVSYIRIDTNKDRLYLHESLDSLIIKLYAVFDDGTEKDITEYTTVDIDASSINTDELGEYTIKATWIYDVDNVLTMDTTYTIKVIEETYASVTDLLVIPKKIVKLNDGSREIRLMVIAYYIDGTTRDVSDNCIISNFDDMLFNEEQEISVSFNAGLHNVYEQTYTIKVNDDGGVSNFKLYYNFEGILELDDSSRTSTIEDPETGEKKEINYPYPEDATYFRVRNPESLSEYYTPSYNELHYDALFTDIKGHELATCKNVIVEFYNADRQLLDSDVYTADYMETV